MVQPAYVIGNFISYKGEDSKLEIGKIDGIIPNHLRVEQLSTLSNKLIHKETAQDPCISLEDAINFCKSEFPLANWLKAEEYLLEYQSKQ